MTEKFEKLILPILEEYKAELVEVQFKGKPGNQTVKVFIHCEDGTTLDKCEKISRLISDILDSEDVIPGKYRLEVSSPGTDRPLHSLQDFRRHLRKNVDILFQDGDVERRIQGKIVDVGDKGVQISSNETTVTVPYDRIKQGKLSLPW